MASDKEFVDFVVDQMGWDIHCLPLALTSSCVLLRSSFAPRKIQSGTRGLSSWSGAPSFTQQSPQ
jgi:hypothetical protein